MNLAALQWAAVADNLPVFAVSVAEPMHRRRRARPAGVVASGVLGFVVGAALGFAFAAGVHAGPHGLVATVSLVLVLVLASALGSLSLRAISA
jgi:Mg/Co/Ni transporter MgtE